MTQDAPAATPSEVVRRGQCMGCGFCTVPLTPDAAAGHMRFDARRGHPVPVFDGAEPTDFICPGAAMDMPRLSQLKFGAAPQDPWLGRVIAIRAAQSTDPDIQSRAASGGAIPALLTHLFETDGIDCAYCVEPGAAPETAAGTILRRAASIRGTHGSVYHPVNFGAKLEDLLASSDRFAFVGLPCEIAALEMLKARRPEIAARHVVSIGLFCGGINTFPGVAYYLEGFGWKAEQVERIEYRHGDWPGKIRLKILGQDEPVVIPRIRGNSRWKILRYVVAFQGYWMLPRCRICPDQVSDFADIAVGDPHLPRFRARTGPGFSIVLTRSARGESIVGSAIGAGRLREEPLSREEAIASQGATLDNRRNAMTYARVARRLGFIPPMITPYARTVPGPFLRHRVSAWVDLAKLAAPRNRAARLLYIPLQVFEYLFLTLAPREIWRRVTNLARNR